MSKLCGSILIAPDLYRSWRLWFCFLLYDGISVRRQVCVLLLVCYCLCVIVCVLLFVCCCLCVVVCVSFVHAGVGGRSQDSLNHVFMAKWCIQIKILKNY